MYIWWDMRFAFISPFFKHLSMPPNFRECSRYIPKHTLGPGEGGRARTFFTLAFGNARTFLGRWLGMAPKWNLQIPYANSFRVSMAHEYTGLRTRIHFAYQWHINIRAFVREFISRINSTVFLPFLVSRSLSPTSRLLVCFSGITAYVYAKYFFKKHWTFWRKS